MYSGSGAKYRIAGTAAVFEPLTSEIVDAVSGNSIEIQFGVGTTAGLLSVQPYATCNTTTDYLFADTVSINLNVASLPDLVLTVDSMAFTCVLDSFTIYAQSTTPSITWDWSYGGYFNEFWRFCLSAM